MEHKGRSGKRVNRKANEPAKKTNSNNEKTSYRPKRKTVEKPDFESMKRKPRPAVASDKLGVRLNKFIADAGICSRREADTYIKAGVVTINGKIINELGVRVMPGDNVKFHNEKISSEKKVYILLNKPKDFITSTDDPQERKTVMELVKNACNERIYPAGRLDRSTTGVLLLTNDGDLAKKLTHPSHNKKKIYHVFLNKNATKVDLEKLMVGIQLEDGPMKVDAVEYVEENDKKQIGVELHSGKNRVVRRLFEALGYSVEKLDRVYFAGLTKKNLPRGKWRFLSDQEVARLKTGMYE
ncbi:MAG: rRNA pseudouridine synthase [Bacteroidales bacterium]|nr:rRNA pseudouridine synthase [Bacteroidales bacterium]